MCYSEACLGSLFIAVIVGFAGVIFFTLKLRKKFLKENLNLTADQIWTQLVRQSANKEFSKSELIFGVWQDKSSTTKTLVVKNSVNDIIARVDYTQAHRKINISIGNDNFYIEYRPTWSRSANLLAPDGKSILASYLKINIFGKHQFSIPNHEALISERPELSFRVIFNYRSNHTLVGTVQEISKTKQIGRLAVLPETLPLAVRIFILAV